MSEEFHPVLTPRVADKPDATVTLSFDDPTEADKVSIQIVEVDAWDTGSGKIAENDGLVVNLISGTKYERQGTLLCQQTQRRYRLDVSLQLDLVPLTELVPACWLVPKPLTKTCTGRYVPAPIAKGGSILADTPRP